MTDNHRWPVSPVEGRGGQKHPACRRVLGAVLLTSAVTLAVLMGPTRHSAGADTSFTATASAAAVRLTVTAENAPLTSTPVDIGGPVAQAQLDSLGTSEAFASFPYPGDVVVNLAGTVAGLTKGAVHLPQYPFYVGSSYPLEPKASTALGPYALAASSQPSSSSATADAGLSGAVAVTSLTTSASVTRHPDGSVVAQSSSTTSPLSLGLLRLGTVTSDATTTLKADGTTTRESHLDISSITIGALSISLTDKGFTILNTTVPLPSLAALNTLLAPQHMQLTYVAARATDHGVISAALQITDLQNLPDVGASSVTYILGQDSATIQGAVFSSGGTQSAPPAGLVGGATPASGLTSGPSEPTGVVQAVAPPAPTLSMSQPSVVAAPPLRATATTVATRQFSVFRLYGILVIAALAALGLGLVFGGMGVRLRWIT
jgi:hypothetical protein